MAVLLLNSLHHRDDWAAAIRNAAPDISLRVWPEEAGDLTDIRHAIVCHPEIGVLKRLPNLAAIHSLWAGIDHVTKDPDLPKSVPLIRMVDHSLSQGMLDYVTGHVYRWHLQMPKFEALQKRIEWRQEVPPLVEERRVGIMGIGTLGAPIAQQLATLGFQVSGWSRSQKSVPGVTCYAGDETLPTFLAASEILVLLLPNTADTADILNAETLAHLPEGAAIINAGRGTLIDEPALIAALDAGALGGATLDVFKTEPLPEDHPFWRHPKITVTPHVAAETRISSASQVIIDNIRRLDAGAPISDFEGVVDHAAGY
ncbi:MAG: glyoxylate/hydroxypyruvate reductase A [Alphaproteobacteria bacterium]|nr:glyoxylate/hydroxypyruvate reductase A [Alphaproteobacteria bacterium]